MDEVRSFFSDESSHNNERRRGSLRKRLSQLRSRLPPNIIITRASSALDMEGGHVLEERDEDQLNLRQSEPFGNVPQYGHLGVESMAETHAPTAGGMGMVEYRVKRLTEHLRSFFARSGMLLRSLSSRRQRGQSHGLRRQHRDLDQEDWLEDASLYSGT